MVTLWMPMILDTQTLTILLGFLTTGTAGISTFAWKIKVYYDQRKDEEKEKLKRNKTDEIHAATRRAVKEEKRANRAESLLMRAEDLLRECEARERARGQA